MNPVLELFNRIHTRFDLNSSQLQSEHKEFRQNHVQGEQHTHTNTLREQHSNKATNMRHYSHSSCSLLVNTMACRTTLHGILASQPYIGLGYAATIKKLNAIAEHCHALLMKESTKNLIQTQSKTRHALP
jgi:hypothetical protein